MGWSEEALTLFRERAIDPDVAASAGVTEDISTGHLVYPTGKRRSLNGGQKHDQPHGQPVKPWPLNWTSPASAVLVTEGETDGLAAHTAMGDKPSPFAGTPILALPACTYPPERLVHGLINHRTKDAFIALDADEAGRQATAKFTQALEARGIRGIPVELPDGFDLAAWLVDGGDLPNALADAEAAYTRERQGISFADVQVEPIEWLWRKGIPRASVTVCAADPGMGKSTWTCVLAAELSRSGLTTLMANAEDPPARVRERLAASGADLGQVRPVDGLVLPDHTDRLREQATETNADLITIDPYNAYLADGINALRDQQVRGALAPLLSIAKAQNCAIVIVCHLNRSGDEENPIYRIPVGLRGIARSILMMQVEGNTTRLIHRKSSYGPLMEDIKYQFEDGGLTEEDGDQQSAVGSRDNACPASSPAVQREGSTEIWNFGVTEFDD